MLEFSTDEIRRFCTVREFEGGRPPLDDARPKVTVVTPSFNQRAFLERTMVSVLNQDYPNLEYILIDGGSTDGSADLIRSFEKHLTFWVSERDNGHTDALQKGFARASGSILAFLNSDDLYLPGAVSSVVQRFEEVPDADVVFGNTYRVDEEEEILHENRQTSFIPKGYLYGGCDLQQPSVFWRAGIFNRVEGIDPSCRFSFDTHLFFKFVAAGARFEFLRRFLSCFRIHASSKTSTISHVGVEEDKALRAEFTGHATTSGVARTMRAVARVRRGVLYATQGDLRWMLHRLASRAMRRG